jgi:DNA modification methylase
MKGAPEKEFWEQQQSVATFEELIKRVTKPRDVVLDPFLGIGTTGVAAVGLKRRFIGSKINDTWFLVAKKRIAEALEKDN